MRNSSLVEGSCAENVTGLKSVAEAVDVQVQVESNQCQWPVFGIASTGDEGAGLGQRLGMVGERSSCTEGRSRVLLERGEVRIPE